MPPSDKKPLKVVPHGHSHEYMKNRVEWRRKVLIPDLRDSGMDMTADDIEEDCQFIEQLLLEIEDD